MSLAGSPDTNFVPGTTDRSARASLRNAPNNQETGSQRGGFGAMALLIFGLVIPLVALAPNLCQVAYELWLQLPFRYFPVSLVAGVVFLVGTCGIGPVGRVRFIASLAILLLGLAIAIWGMFNVSTMRVHLAAIIIVFGWALGTYGGASWTRIAAVCSLFFVTLSLPFGWSSKIALLLQSAAGSACNGFLEAVYVPNVFESGVLRAEQTELSVFEIGRDAGSCFALLAFALAWLVYWRRPLVVGVAVILSVLFCSVLTDILRLLFLLFASQMWNTNLSEGSYGIVISILTFLLSAAMVVVFDTAASAFFAPIELDSSPSSTMMAYQNFVTWPSESNLGAWTAIRHPNPAMILGLPALICLVLGGMTLWGVYIRPPSASLVESFSQQLADRMPGEGVFPEQFGMFKRTNYSVDARPGQIGRYSHSWQFSGGDSQVIASLDFPFAGWTSTARLYETVGWKLEQSSSIDMAAEAPWTIEELSMTNRFGVCATAWHGFFDETGVPLSSNQSASRRVTLLDLVSGSSSSGKRHFQVRMFLESGRKLTPEESEPYRKFFAALFQRLRETSTEALHSEK
ncbi:MAG: exosortase U [Pirellula sp.]